MKVSAALFFTLLVFACRETPSSSPDSAANFPGIHADVFTPRAAGAPQLAGDLNGDHAADTATVMLVKPGAGSPVDGGTADGYEVWFSDRTIAAIDIGCCEAIIVPEGDLDGDGRDELSVFGEPVNGCTYHFRTYTFKDEKWTELIGFLVPTGCDNIPGDEELEARVVQENGAIYYYETDPNTLELLKKRVK